MSQTRLARRASVSRFKLCMFELGDGTLTADEEGRISQALQAEADRLRALPVLAGLAGSKAGGGRAA
jgi:hypothetical protein